MKNPIIALAALAASSAAAAPVPIRWTVETSRVAPAAIDAYHGETLQLEASLQSYGRPLAVVGETPYIYWQTNGMGAVYWSAPATCSNNVLRADFTPEMDTGAAVVHGFIGSPGENYRASYTLRFRASPGATPNVLPLPTPTLDFATVEVLNPPWTDPDYSTSNAALVATIEATAPAPGNYAAVSNAAVYAAITNALQDAAISTLSTANARQDSEISSAQAQITTFIDDLATKADSDDLLDYMPLVGDSTITGDITINGEVSINGTGGLGVEGGLSVYGGSAALYGGIAIGPAGDQRIDGNQAGDKIIFEGYGEDGPNRSELQPDGSDVMTSNRVAAAISTLSDSISTLNDTKLDKQGGTADNLLICGVAEAIKFADDLLYIFRKINGTWVVKNVWDLRTSQDGVVAFLSDIPTVPTAQINAATTTNALQDTAIESNRVSIASHADSISSLSDSVSALSDTTSTVSSGLAQLADEAAPAINGYARLYRFVTGSTNANFVVTNYQLTAEAEASRTHFDPSDPDLDFSTVPPSLRLEDASSGTNRVVVDTRDWVVWYYAQKIGGAMAEAVSTAVDTCRAWCGFTATGLENPAPDTLVVDVPNIWLMAGKTFEKHIAGSNAVWIIRSSGVVMPISDNSQSAGGFLELTDAFGTPYIRFKKTESYFVDPAADGVEYDSATGAWLVTYTTTTCPKGGANAVLEGSTTYPGKAILKDEDDPDCPATITWTGSANNWVMHAVPKQIDGAVPPKMFFAAVVEVQGQDYIEYLRPMSVPSLMFNGTTYTSTVSGNELKFIATQP